MHGVMRLTCLRIVTELNHNNQKFTTPLIPEKQCLYDPEFNVKEFLLHLK